MRYNKETGKVLDKLPAKLGAAVDLLYDIRMQRQQLARVVEGLKKSESMMKDALVKKFKKDELNGAKGGRGQCELKPKDIPTLKDPAKFYAHLKKTGDFSLLQRRFNTEAVAERWEAGKTIPGVEKFHVVAVSITKRPSKK